MFQKILIANRGEIACRIMQTAQRLGTRCVAVYSDADCSSKHVQMADEAWRLGPPEVGESYLLIDKIVDIALKSGADSIHPGYGFLSENPEFVEACKTAGVGFIGPPASAIRAMGLKDGAKKLMENSGVPVVPGYHGENQDAEFLQSEAEKIGYPVLIKARAGGGGKGMRLVKGTEDFNAALQSAQREAQSSFADPRVLVEKFIQSPRHIEVQVFADRHGNTVHLFERDCSLQRRHQKVIEEAPAPGMHHDMREAMGQAAVKACQAVRYCGAGTVEFIVDASDGLQADKFWFMEMNTRLQVEHPVTEMITGLDLVEWQLRIASGESLPLRQEEIPLNGHAFEARIYAEDAEKGFMPAIGTLHHLSLPGHRARVDSGVREGDEITPFYDPMIAKLITYAPNRQSALNTLTSALSECRIAGCTTNIAFLHRLSRHEGFASGTFDTGLIDRELETLVRVETPDHELIAVAAMASCGLLTPSDSLDPWQALRGWRQWSQAQQFTHLQWRDRPITCRVISDAGNHLKVYIDEECLKLELLNIEANQVRLRINGHNTSLYLLQHEQTVTLYRDAFPYIFSLPDQLSEEDENAASEDNLVAPMPGKIVSVMVNPGSRIEAGDTLIIMEAMKMEHALAAPRNGTVDQLMVETGDQVSEGTLLLNLGETQK